MGDIGVLVGIPVLTLDVSEMGLKKEFIQMSKDYDFPLHISIVGGFGLPELRLDREGYIRGSETIKKLIEYYSEHGHYRPFLDCLV